VNSSSNRSLARTATVTINPEGIWLLRANGNAVVIDGDGIDQLITAERRLRYRPTNRQRAVDIVTQFEGISGPITGTMEDSDDQTFAMRGQILENIKRNPTEEVQLIFASVSKPVLVSNLTLLPDPEYRGDMNRHRVSFYVDQCGDFDFRLCLMDRAGLSHTEFGIAKKTLTLPHQRRLEMHVLDLADGSHMRTLTNQSSTARSPTT
jgi:hypothetical protein